MLRLSGILAINVSRLRGTGHVKRLDENELTTRSMECKPEGVKMQRTTKVRMEKWVVEDLSRFRIKGWWMIASDRES